jgi:hypothetical protein
MMSRGAGVEREAEPVGGLDRPDEHVVEHLQRRRHDPGADDVADRVRRLVHGVEHAEERAVRLRVLGDPHPHLRHDPERPFRADDGAGEVVPPAVLARPAGGDDAAVRQHQLDAEDVVDGDAVLEGVRAAAVRGDVPAEGAGALAGRVRGVVVAERLEGVREPHVHHPRLDDGVPVADVHFEDPLHPRQADHDPAADRHAPAGEARPGPAGEERQAEVVAGGHDADDLLGAGREDDHLGPVLLDRVPVALVDREVGGGGEDVVGADDAAHPGGEPGLGDGRGGGGGGGHGGSVSGSWIGARGAGSA